MNEKIGLWAKQSKNGNVYYAGKLKINNKEYKFQLFKTETKKSEKSPDYTLFIRDSINTKEEVKTVEIPPKAEEKKEDSMSDDVFAEFGDSFSIDDSLPF